MNSGLIEQFRREFLHAIPASMLVDPRLLIKHIRKFYRAKGSVDAYRLLFRILFDEEVDFYYPSEDILRASDGRWTVETVVRATAPFVGDPQSMLGRIITGLTSRASGRVENITNFILNGLIVWELVLSTVTGTFIDGETIQDETETIQATVNDISGKLRAFTINNGGAFHSQDDSISITTEFSETSGGGGGSAKVLSMEEGTGADFRILTGGSGYRISNTIITLSPSLGTGAAFTITALANTTFINLNTDLINSVKNVVLSTGATFSTLGTNSTTLSANLAAANVSSTIVSGLAFYAQSVGSIQTINLTSIGKNYSTSANGLPIVTVEDVEIAAEHLIDAWGQIVGKNAVIVAMPTIGAIKTLGVVAAGDGYGRNDRLNFTNASRGITPVTELTGTDTQTGDPLYRRRAASYQANGFPLLSALRVNQGRYTDTKGFLSWNCRLQDNFYYQAFSYVLRSPVLLAKYHAAVKALVHPAGTQLFGTYLMSASLNLHQPFTQGPYSIMLPQTVSANTTAEATGRPWIADSGTISIEDHEVISAFSGFYLFTYRTFPCALTCASNTVFYTATANLTIATAVSRDIEIQALSEATANGHYLVDGVYANSSTGLALFHPAYAGNYLTSGKFFYQT